MKPGEIAASAELSGKAKKQQPCPPVRLFSVF